MRILPSSNTIKKHGIPWVLKQFINTGYTSNNLINININNNDTKQTKYIDNNKLKKDKKNTQLN